MVSAQPKCGVPETKGTSQKFEISIKCGVDEIPAPSPTPTVFSPSPTPTPTPTATPQPSPPPPVPTPNVSVTSTRILVAESFPGSTLGEKINAAFSALKGGPGEAQVFSGG